MSVVMTFQNFTTSAYAAAINVHPCVVSHDYSGAPSCAYLDIYVYFICVIHMCAQRSQCPLVCAPRYLDHSNV